PEREPGSIWPGTASRNRLFSDFRARDVGDIITVLISDSTSAKKEANTNTGTNSSEDAAVTDVLGMPLAFGMSNFMGLGNRFSPSLSGSRKSSFDGDGSTERKGSITATIAVRVIDVLPNGNLYVEGKKETTVNRENQHVILSGIVRPVDVSSVNSVYSDMISDLRVEISGYGVISDKQKPGWFTRILDHTWPF
ncbi:MAG: flagellar basal body L-ring protein FlgH, partial [Thermodesulfobacteriota bacterium]